MTIKRFLLPLLLAFVIAASAGWPAPAARGGEISGKAGAPLVVAIDVGHGKASGGAQSATGIPEHTFNQAIAKALMTELASDRTIKPFLINEKGESVSPHERPRIASSKGAGLLISIHHDSVQPGYLQTWIHNGARRHHCDLFSGFSLFVCTGNRYEAASLRLASLVGAAMLQHQFHPSLHHAEKIRGENRKLLDQAKGIYQFNELAVLKNAAMPAILVECGIIVNRAEEQSLLDPKVQAAIVSALSQAIRDYATNC